ncbi:MAG: ABC transporter permease [Clostridiales bacterium GWC2_40_7]|nr:MAG: ABC transporter permease [Clostridiales bacterium GWC2_40_7]
MKAVRLAHRNSKQKIVLYIFFVIVAFFFLFPILWTLSLSLKTIPELFEIPPSILPKTFTGIGNYLYVISNYGITGSLLNSLYITLWTVIGCLTVTLPAAYAFSRMKFKFSSQIQFIILMFQMISPLVIVIPLYKYYSSLNLLNSFTGLITIYIAISAPFQVWFLKGFLDTIPKELDEASIIDGCSRLQTLIKVLIPIISPGVLSSVLLISIMSWSQFIVPYILIDSPAKMPISVRLLNLQSSLTNITTHYLAAASIIAIFPTVLLFVFLQKYIVSAMTAGSVKG